MAADGPDVYEKKCKVCHSIGGSAGPMAKMGGALDGVGAKRDEAWLNDYVQNPKSKMPSSKMPVIRMSDEERKAVVRYMRSLK
jgi:cytochrome c2